jgi:precorrin-3B C17-methyltransferase
MKIYVVGLGPGSVNRITPEAMEALQSCQVITGYTVYIDQIKGLFPENNCWPPR